MKIIDLFNKMVNGEDLPEKIKLQGYDYIFTLREDCTGYKWYGEEKSHNSIGETICQNLEYVLTCEVEILDDEEKGLPEKIKITEKSITVKGTTFFRDKDIEIFQKLSMQINEIIDYLENKGKGNEDDWM